MFLYVINIPPPPSPCVNLCLGLTNLTIGPSIVCGGRIFESAFNPLDPIDEDLKVAGAERSFSGRMRNLNAMPQPVVEGGVTFGNLEQ